MPAIYLICAWILAVALLILWPALCQTFWRAYHQWRQNRRQETAKAHRR